MWKCRDKHIGNCERRQYCKLQLFEFSWIHSQLLYVVECVFVIRKSVFAKTHRRTIITHYCIVSVAFRFNANVIWYVSGVCSFFIAHLPRFTQTHADTLHKHRVRRGWTTEIILVDRAWFCRQSEELSAKVWVACSESKDNKTTKTLAETSHSYLAYIFVGSIEFCRSMRTPGNCSICAATKTL